MIWNRIKACLGRWKWYYDPLIQDILRDNDMTSARVYYKGLCFMILYKQYNITFPIDMIDDQGERVPSTRQAFGAYITEKVNRLKELENER